MFKKNQIFVLGSESFTALLGLVFLLLGYKYLPIEMPSTVNISTMLSFFFKWLSLPTLTIILGVFLVMFKRITTKAINPILNVNENEYMKIFKQYLQNTLEQAVIFVFAQLGLISVLAPGYIKLIPLFAILFFTGRIIFLAGYLYHPILRAPGFGLTFYPSVLVVLFVLYSLIF